MAIALRPVLRTSLLRMHYQYHFSALTTPGNRSHVRPSNPPPQRPDHARTTPHLGPFAYPIGHNPCTSGAMYGRTRINTDPGTSHYMNYVQSHRTKPHLPAKNSRASCPSGSGGAGVRHVARFFPIIHNTPLQNFRI
jgi:hypothetical protein